MATDIRDKIAPPSTMNEQLLERSIRHQVYIQRYGTRLGNEMIKLLDEAVPDIARILAERLAKTTKRGYDLGPATTRRLQRLYVALNEVIDLARSSTYAALTADLVALARSEGLFETGMIAVEAKPINIEFLLPNPTTLASVVTSRPFEGKHLREWFDELTRRQKKGVQQAVRLGITEGEGIEQIVRRIIGTQANGFADGILHRSRQELRMVTRTATNHVSTQARQSVHEANRSVVKGEKIVATLDGRTSPICRRQDGKFYPIGEGPRPPFHPNCRTTIVPVLKSWRELGIDLKEAPKGTRAAFGGEVPADVTYAQWWKGQSRAFKRDDIGPKRLKLIETGKIKDVNSFSNQQGRLLTLEELETVERDAFEAAGVKV